MSGGVADELAAYSFALLPLEPRDGEAVNVPSPEAETPEAEVTGLGGFPWVICEHLAVPRGAERPFRAQSIKIVSRSAVDSGAPVDPRTDQSKTGSRLQPRQLPSKL
jgi:hypothetical protein